MSLPTPTTASVKSLAQWNEFFHPTEGVFRKAAQQGNTIHTLEIDLRYVDESNIGKSNRGNTIYLPQVCTLILRGGEYCQDDDKRVDCLVEVLDAVNPVEFQWLHANGNPEEDTFSLSTHMVHSSIINAGRAWSNLMIQQVQGGYPCPNFYAPTPYSVTPAHTPLPSPGLSHNTFAGLQRMAQVTPPFPNDRPTTPIQPELSSIPTISAFKTRHVDPVKLAQRAERYRLASYALKPRFEYAFGSWAPEVLMWSFEGRYTPAAIKTIITSLVKAFTSTFPSSCENLELDLPSLFALRPVPVGLIDELRQVIQEETPSDVMEYLQDVMFIGTNSFARLFDDYAGNDRDRQARRLKAEMLLMGNKSTIVSLDSLMGKATLAPVPTSVGMVSPAYSYSSLTNDTDYASDPEALTPDLQSSEMFDSVKVREGSKSRSPSVDKKEGKTVGLGMGFEGIPIAR